MFDWFSNRGRKSKDIAKERLQLAITYDKLRIPHGVLDKLKDDLIDVISAYLDIDERGITVEVANERDAMALVASIPVMGLRRRSGRPTA